MSVGKVTDFDVANGAWSSYVDRLEMYFLVNKIGVELKLPTLISVMGNEAYELLVNLASPKKPSELTYAVAVDMLRNHLETTPSALAERYRFRQRRQVSGENMANYVAELKKLARNCKFQGNLNENLRDQFVCGIKSDIIRQRLFAEDDSLTYAEAVKLATSLEAAERDAAAVEVRGSDVTADAGQAPVHSVQARAHGSGGGGGARGRGPRAARRAPGGPRAAPGPARGGGGRPGGPDRGERHCAACGATNHEYDECRFRDYECSRCGRIGHLRRVCSNNTRSGRGHPGSSGRGFHYGGVVEDNQPQEEARQLQEDFHQLCLNNYKAV